MQAHSKGVTPQAHPAIAPRWAVPHCGKGSRALFPTCRVNTVRGETYSSWAHTNKHLQELRPTNGDERDVGFSSRGLSQQCLPSAWRTGENGTLQIKKGKVY